MNSNTNDDQEMIDRINQSAREFAKILPPALRPRQVTLEEMKKMWAETVIAGPEHSVYQRNKSENLENSKPSSEPWRETYANRWRQLWLQDLQSVKNLLQGREQRPQLSPEQRLRAAPIEIMPKEDLMARDIETVLIHLLDALIYEDCNLDPQFPITAVDSVYAPHRLQDNLQGYLTETRKAHFHGLTILHTWDLAQLTQPGSQAWRAILLELYEEASYILQKVFVPTPDQITPLELELIPQGFELADMVERLFRMYQFQVRTLATTLGPRNLWRHKENMEGVTEITSTQREALSRVGQGLAMATRDFAQNISGVSLPPTELQTWRRVQTDIAMGWYDEAADLEKQYWNLYWNEPGQHLLRQAQLNALSTLPGDPAMIVDPTFLQARNHQEAQAEIRAVVAQGRHRPMLF